MVKYPNANLIRNPFKFYRYEVVGAYRDFIFSTKDVPTRSSMDEDGYDDVTEHDKLENSSEEIKLRYLPFMEQISEDEFMGIHNKVIFSDLIATQPWASKVSDAILLLDKLRYDDELRVDKIQERDFLGEMVNALYSKENGDAIEVDNIDSFDVEFVYYYNRSSNAVELSLANIKFNIKVINKRIDVDFKPIVWIPHSLIKYYFDVDFYVEGRELIFKTMQKEYAFTPAMVFDGELYSKIKDKIGTVGYDCSWENV
jgi:hypothetical protein